jgi:hypothetical protein
MRENRPYGSEGGEAQSLPVSTERLCINATRNPLR